MAGEDGLQLEVQRRCRVEAGTPAAAESRDAFHPAGIEQLLGEGREEDDVRRVVGKERVEIAGVPSVDPSVSESVRVYVSLLSQLPRAAS